MVERGHVVALLLALALAPSGCTRGGPAAMAPDVRPGAATVKAAQAPAGAAVSREVALRQAGRFLQRLGEQKFDDALTLANEAIKQALPAPRLKQTWEQVQAQAGAYQRPITTQAVVHRSSHVVDTTCAFANAPLTVRISIDGRGRVEGLFFRPANFKRPQHPRPPFPYAARDVTYKNPTDGSTMAATLTIPRGQGPHPAALLITGSGAQDRDETIFGHKPFLVLADHLTRQGIAVLRVDDRGVGGSTGDVATATIQTHATDVTASAAFLRTQPEVDARRVGLIGHSEGGILAALVASRSKQVAFVVSLAGTGLPGAEINLLQMALLLRATPGISPALQAQLTAAQRKIIQLIKADADEAVLGAAIRAATALQHQGSSAAQVEGDVATAITQATSPWFRSFVKLDPREAWREVRCPVLALVGERDTQVPADVNLAAIATALAAAGGKDVTTKKLPALNHLFQTCRTGLLGEYGQLEETFHAPTLELISSWIRARMIK